MARLLFAILALVAIAAPIAHRPFLTTWVCVSSCRG
jgi:hypothetical protein